jgi:uncharacterized protein YuzE
VGNVGKACKHGGRKRDIRLYGTVKVGGLFREFRHADHMEGEATADGKVIIHYDEKDRIAAVEITDMTGL